MKIQAKVIDVSTPEGQTVEVSHLTKRDPWLHALIGSLESERDWSHRWTAIVVADYTVTPHDFRIEFVSPCSHAQPQPMLFYADGPLIHLRDVERWLLYSIGLDCG